MPAAYARFGNPYLLALLARLEARWLAMPPAPQDGPVGCRLADRCDAIRAVLEGRGVAA